MYTGWEVHFRRAMTYVVHGIENRKQNLWQLVFNIHNLASCSTRQTEPLKYPRYGKWLLCAVTNHKCQDSCQPRSQALLCGQRAWEWGYSYVTLLPVFYLLYWQILATFPGPTQVSIPFPYYKRWKAGRGLEIEMNKVRQICYHEH